MVDLLTSDGCPGAVLHEPGARPRLQRVAHAAGEAVLMGALFVAYRQVRHITQADRGVALDNARRVIRWEQRLHLFTEHGLQRVVAHSELVIEILNRYYVFVHFTATTTFLLWAYIRHNHEYRRIKVHFIAVTVAALGLHVAFPLAPPRMLRQFGFIDTLQRYGPRIYSLHTTKSVANQFAAMPSLHFGWAVLVAISFIGIRRSRASWLIVIHPLLTLLAIVATANHYWLDALAALALVALFSPTRRYRGAMRVHPSAQQTTDQSQYIARSVFTCSPNDT